MCMHLCILYTRIHTRLYVCMHESVIYSYVVKMLTVKSLSSATIALCYTPNYRILLTKRKNKWNKKIKSLVCTWYDYTQKVVKNVQLFVWIELDVSKYKTNGLVSKVNATIHLVTLLQTSISHICLNSPFLN